MCTGCALLRVSKGSLFIHLYSDEESLTVFQSLQIRLRSDLLRNNNNNK